MDYIVKREMVWDGRQWRLEDDSQTSALQWEIDMTANLVRENSTRFVKRAPLGMHLTRDGGFRMVGGAQ